MPSLRRLFVKFSCYAALILAVSSCLSAQTTSVTDQNEAPTPGVGRNYLGTLNETVDPASGKVTVKIPIAAPPGRKFTVGTSFNYFSMANCLQANPNQTTLASGCGPGDIPYPYAEGEWSQGVPLISRFGVSASTTKQADGSSQCLATTGYSFVDAQGAQHDLQLANSYDFLAGSQESEACQHLDYLNARTGGDEVVSAALVGASSDGFLNTDPTNYDGQPTVIDAHGNRYSFGGGNDWCSLPNNPANFAIPTTVSDRLGNSVSISVGPGTNNCNGTITYVDTIGRTAISASWPSFNGSTATASVSVEGLANSYSLNWTTVSGSSGYAWSAKQVLGPAPPVCENLTGGSSGGGGQMQRVTSLGLPNGQEYRFSYDPTYGELSKITYPSGGYVSYSWGLNNLSSDVELSGTVNSGPPPECGYNYDTLAVTHRYVSFDGTHNALQQDFSYQTTWDTAYPFYWDTKQTTVTTHDLVRGTTFKTVTIYAGMYLPPAVDILPQSQQGISSQVPVEIQIQYYDTNGGLIKTVNKGWNGPFELVCQLTTLGPSITSGPTHGVYYYYGPGAQIKDIKEYDFGILSAPTTPGCTVPQTPPTPTRETVTAYATFPTPTGFAGPVLLDRPSTIKVYAGGTSGTLMEETDFTYDNGTPSVGNATKTVKRCLVSGSPCSQGDAVTNFTFDSNGQVTSMTDAKGNLTQYSYADVYSGTNCAGNAPPTSPSDAYLTGITYPATNGVAHTVGYCYDYKTGLLLTSKDENGQITAYKYADSLNRPTETDDPDGGQTTISYSDTAPNPSVTTTKKINGSQSETSTAIMDGLGHAIETQLTSDPQGTDYATTIYDGLGHVYQAYNSTRCSTPAAPSPWNLPVNCGSETTWGATTYTYDALGRTLRVQHPDGSSSQTLYTGRAVEVKDEGNGTNTVQRISQADGLGRLVAVCEVTSTNLIGNGGATSDCGNGVSGGLDIDANGFLTTYTYDVLGNLTAVTQGTMNGRSFTYDSLSHLLTATNPESGTITYTYDADGNLATKIDARGITTCFGAWNGTSCNSAAGYDALNRLLEKTYSDGTPTVNFAYDVCPSSPACPSGDSHQYTTGRLVAAYTSQAQEFESYDPMGRVQDEWQCTPYNCSGTPWHLNDVYDQAGDVTSFTNAMGTTFSQTFDSAARLSQFTSSWSDSQHPGTLLQGTCATGVSSAGICYNALSDVLTASLGNGLAESVVYGVRGQLQSETVSNGAGATPATGLLTINGSEQNYYQSATQSAATIQIASGCNSNCGSGTVYITINGIQKSANWSGSLGNEASAIATAARNTGLVSASSSEVTSGVWKASLTSVASGSSANYSLSCDVDNLSQCPSSMTGGQNAGTIYDAGQVTAYVNGHADSVSYGQTSTFTGLASALASAINNDGSAPVTAVANGEVISVTSKASGAGANYSMSVSATSGNPTHFNPPSFSIQDSGPSLVGGTGGYGYDLAYAPNGDLLAANDSVNGNWYYTYDDFNRLVGSSCSSHCPDGLNTQGFSYVYDRYANRWRQNVTAGSGPAPQLSFTGNNNRMDGYSYDASGNLLNDGTHSYTYDAESRIIAVDGGSTAAYVYDAEGRRAQKTTASGTVNYVYDIAGQQVAEVNSSGGLNRAEVYAGGWHLATYTNSTTYFNHADWLGTERMRTQVSGGSCETITSLPFGDGQSTSGSCDPTPMHFTGKQRDTETNLDDFDARYYSSQWGRFISADWSAVPEPVPYANLTNPQTLNLYAIVADDPSTDVDADGHFLILAGDVATDENALKEMAGSYASDIGFQTLNGVTSVTFTCGASQDCSNLMFKDMGAEQIQFWVASSALFVFSADSVGKDAYVASIQRMFSIGNHHFSMDAGPDFDIDPWHCKGGCVPVYASTIPIGPKLSEAEMEELFQAAEKAYPKLAKLADQLHHVVPKYLGGAKDGELSKIPAAYHQQITNMFRTLAPYGQKIKPTAEAVVDIVRKVYSVYPLP